MRPFALPVSIVLFTLGFGSLAWDKASPAPISTWFAACAKEHLPDLALQYLDIIKAGQLDTETRLLDVEYARTWLDLAAEETDEGKRVGLISQAKQKLEAFILANPKHPLSGQASIDLAKLYSVQGKSLIRKARRLEDPKEQETEMKAAQPLLKAAAEKYKSTAAAINKQIDDLGKDKNSANDKKRRDLLEFRLNAQLDEGITYYYLGETYVGQETKDITEQGNQFKAAKKLFEMIRYEDEKLPIRWIAMAWGAQCDLKAGDAGASEKTMTELLGKKTVPAAAAGIRVARYFTILNNFANSARDYAKLEKDTEAWLKDYASQRDSTEGLGCRYYLALAKKNNGIPGLIFDKKTMKLIGITAQAKSKFEQAQQIFKDLENSENEYAERSGRHRSQILVTLADAEGNGDEPPLESLPNFKRAYLMAQVQIARFAQFRTGGGKTPPSEEDIKKEIKRRFTNAKRYLEHALRLANPAKDGIREIFAAQMTLVSCYYQLKLYPQGAVLAEHLARENPKMGSAPKAGSAAVTMYNMAQIELKKLKENAANAEDKVWEDSVKADVDHLSRAASFMIKQWPADAATDESRHILGFYALRDRKLEEAWKALAGIGSSYPAIQYARLQLASTMWSLVYPTDEKDPAKFKQATAERLKRYEKEWKQTIALMENTPPPEDGASESDVSFYLDNRTQFARLHQLEDKQDKAQQLGEAIVKEVGTFTKLNEQQKMNFKLIGQNLVLIAVRAQAYQEFKNGNHARVAELLGPRLTEIEKEFDKKAPEEPSKSFQDLRKTQRSTVVLALQSCVQDGKIDRAGELLDVLEKSGSAEDSLSLLQTLVSGVPPRSNNWTPTRSG